MKIITKGLTSLGIFFSFDWGQPHFFDDSSDKAKNKEVWEVIHRNWKINDGLYWALGKADLKSVPLTLLPI